MMDSGGSGCGIATATTSASASTNATVANVRVIHQFRYERKSYCKRTSETPPPMPKSLIFGFLCARIKMGITISKCLLMIYSDPKTAAASQPQPQSRNHNHNIAATTTTTTSQSGTMNAATNGTPHSGYECVNMSMHMKYASISVDMLIMPHEHWKLSKKVRFPMFERLFDDLCLYKSKSYRIWHASFYIYHADRAYFKYLIPRS